MLQGLEHDFEGDMVELFQDQGYNYTNGKELEKTKTDVILESRLRSALARINPEATEKTVRKAASKIVDYQSENPERENKNQYQYLINGVTVENEDNEMVTLYPLDFDDISNNDFLVSNQVRVRFRDGPERVPDLVVYLNGIPIAVFELKGSDRSSESLEVAHNQIQEYKIDVPNLFFYNQFVSVASRNGAKVGSFTAPWEWMSPWKYIHREPENKGDYEYKPEYVSLVRGLFDKQRLLDVIENYVMFSQNGTPNKIVPAYYQYYGVKNALNNTLNKLDKSTSDGIQNRQIGLFSHCQGSGKSISIAEYIRNVKSRRPSALFVVLTDTNGLDEQLHYETLEELGINATHADSISDLRQQLRNAQHGGGGVITTTVQKFQSQPSRRALEHLNRSKKEYNMTDFSKLQSSPDVVADKIDEAEVMIGEKNYLGAISKLNELPEDMGNLDEENVNRYDVDEGYLDSFEHPVLNERNDIIVIADEAHRSQDKSLGLNVRTALPNASHIGFTATPIYEVDENVTAKWFGEEVSSYMMDQAVEDESVVEIDYEKRGPKIGLDDDKLEQAYREEEAEAFEKVSFEDIIKNEERQKKIAKDVVQHSKDREVDGEVMLVAYDREAAAKYERIIRELPENDPDIESVPETHAIMSNPADYGLSKDDNMKKRFKDPEDDFKIAIVCDKWTTGFNVKPLHTIYLDKPIRDHNLVQTLGRVNRVSDNKESGRVVDYVGIEDTVKRAFSMYTTGQGAEGVKKSLPELVDDFVEKFEDVASNINMDGSSVTEGPEFDRAVEREMKNIKKSGRVETYAEEFQDLKSIYRRIHPCAETEERFSQMMFLAAIYSRLLATEGSGSGGSENGTDEGSDIQKVIDRSVEAEEAIQVKMIEDGEISENISNPSIDIPRAGEGIEEVLDNQTNYSLKTYDEVKEEIEEAVEKYNDRVIDTQEATGQLEDALEKVEEEQKRSENLGLNNRQLSIYDILVEEGGLDTELAKSLSVDIDEIILEFAGSKDWPNVKQQVSDAKMELYDYLHSQDLTDCDNIFDLSEVVVEDTKELY